MQASWQHTARLRVTSALLCVNGQDGVRYNYLHVLQKAEQLVLWHNCGGDHNAEACVQREALY